MKKNNLLQRILLLLSIVFFAASCSDDDSVIGMKEGEGQMTFSFIRINGYTLTQMDEVASVKITLEKDGIRKELKSLSMSGNKDSISSEPCFLEAGAYKLVKYCTYDRTAALLTESFPKKDHQFSVENGAKNDFIMPVVVNHKLDKNNILNTLHAICLDALGPDKSLWPKTWNKEHDLEEWENLEFAEYEDGSIAYVEGLTLDSKFASMKKLSPSIVNFGALKSLVIRDNALEELPANFGQLNIESLQISNTNLSKFPESMARMELYSILLDGNKFTSFPELLYTQKELRVLHLMNEQINVIPAELTTFKELTSLNLINLNITELPDIFDVLYRISTLDISGNKQLTTLPSTIKPESFGNQISYLRAIHANGCGFTSIPEEVISPKFKMLMFSDNKLSEVRKSDLEAMTNLHTLYLSGNKMTSFPTVEMPELRMLVLIGCGLTPDQVDREGMPNLYSSTKDINTGEVIELDFLFFTQDHFDKHFKGYVVENK
ncbi:MAG: hypothetical protein RR202_07935 [Bacteroidales bacterium]